MWDKKSKHSLVNHMERLPIVPLFIVTLVTLLREGAVEISVLMGDVLHSIYGCETDVLPRLVPAAGRAGCASVHIFIRWGVGMGRWLLILVLHVVACGRVYFVKDIIFCFRV